MPPTSSLLPCLARVVLKVAHDDLANGRPPEGPFDDVARETWDGWSRLKNAEQRREELEALARIGAEDMSRRVNETADRIAAGQPEVVRVALRLYLLRVATNVRRVCHGPGGLVPARPEDLLQLLPDATPDPQSAERLPRSNATLLGGLIAGGVLVVALMVVVLYAILGPANATDRATQQVQADTEPEHKPTTPEAKGNSPRPAFVPAIESEELVAASVGMKLVRIEAGSFLMGLPDSDTQAEGNEKPQHRVSITRSFYLGQHEVTVGQFEAFVKDNPDFKTDAEKDGKGGCGPGGTQRSEYNWRNPGFKQSPDHPVVNVSWNDAVAFCAWLSKKEGREYRLPTEAEWEYACRAGTTTRYHFGDDASALSDHAWHTRNSETGTQPVGQKKPSVWKLFDMHGNVWEWCADDLRTFTKDEVKDPSEQRMDGLGVLRGGGWMWRNRVEHCPTAFRFGNRHESRCCDLGFRVACSSAASRSAAGPRP